MNTRQQLTSEHKSKYRITREPWDENRSARASLMAVLRSISRDRHSTPMERLAASCVHYAISELWYGYYPAECNYTIYRSQERREKALYDLEHGGIDLWLSVLHLPVDATLKRIVSLNPATALPKAIDKRTKEYRDKMRDSLTQ